MNTCQLLNWGQTLSQCLANFGNFHRFHKLGYQSSKNYETLTELPCFNHLFPKESCLKNYYSTPRYWLELPGGNTLLMGFQPLPCCLMLCVWIQSTRGNIAIVIWITEESYHDEPLPSEDATKKSLLPPRPISASSSVYQVLFVVTDEVSEVVWAADFPSNLHSFHTARDTMGQCLKNQGSRTRFKKPGSEKIVSTSCLPSLSRPVRAVVRDTSQGLSHPWTWFSRYVPAGSPARRLQLRLTAKTRGPWKKVRKT